MSKDVLSLAQRCNRISFSKYLRGETHLFFYLLAGILLGIWLLLFALGKGGFVHILLLNAIAVAVIKIVCDYRARVTK